MNDRALLAKLHGEMQARHSATSVVPVTHDQLKAWMDKIAAHLGYKTNVQASTNFLLQDKDNP